AAGVPGPDDEGTHADRALARLRHAARGVRQLIMSFLQAGARRLLFAPGALFAAQIASPPVLGPTYHLAIRLPRRPLHAASLTVRLLLIVVPGDFSVREQSALLVGAAICLMLAGALFVAVFFALLTNMIVRRQIEVSLGRRRITGLSDHVVVIGLGSVGFQVV